MVSSLLKCRRCMLRQRFKNALYVVMLVNFWVKASCSPGSAGARRGMEHFEEAAREDGAGQAVEAARCATAR